MTENKIKSDICIGDIHQKIYQEFAKKHGIKIMLDLLENCGGSVIYIPSYNAVLREPINQAILEGKAKTSLSKKQIGEICRN